MEGAKCLQLVITQYNSRAPQTAAQNDHDYNYLSSINTSYKKKSEPINLNLLYGFLDSIILYVARYMSFMGCTTQK